MIKKIDFIGDVHGYADQLEELLIKLGYSLKNGEYSHKSRKVIFVGDYIDRGPKIRETLQIVKSMVENGNAIALLGNHEYNAICFNTKKKEGDFLRKHSIKNITQHFEMIQQFTDYQNEYDSYIEWFKTLPLFYETDNFRVVHACWDNNQIEYLKNNLIDNQLKNNKTILQSTIKGTELNIAINTILNGKKIKLPNGYEIRTKDGKIRNKIRIKWWASIKNSNTYNDISVETIDNLPNIIIDKLILSNNYGKTEKPVFFGHYWLDGKPSLFNDNICCLDYSIAKKGKLVAYRYNFENKLSNEKFISIAYNK
ncbi:MAG TPA: phosphoesterase [Bacteroidia bacterium]|nr:phosphoesterase [Bacteroidia bacterium]